MWDAIKEVLVSSNGINVIILAFIVLTMIVYFAKNGMFHIRTEHVMLGSSEKERKIIRQQIEWTRAYVSGLELQLKMFIEKKKNEYLSTKDDDAEAERGSAEMVDGQIKEYKWDRYHALYILARVQDEVEDWITFNHIDDNDAYIEMKKQTVRAKMRQMTTRALLQSEEFLSMVDRWTEECVKTLVKIRKVYGGKK